MYYELIILGTLMGGAFHGYLIAKIVQNISGPYGKISAGRLYPLLAKLEAAGLIVAESALPSAQQGARSHIPSRSYRITSAGQARFHAVMLDTALYLGDYPKLFLQKVVYFSFVAPHERLHLIDHYQDYCRILLLHGTTQASALAQADGSPQNPTFMTRLQAADLVTAMQHKMGQWQAELDWCAALRAQVQASLAAPAATPQATEESV